MKRESRCSVALVVLSVIAHHSSSVLGFTPTSSRATIIRPPLHVVKRFGSEVIGNHRSSVQGKASDKLRLRAADEAAAGDLSNNEEDASTNKNEEETPPTPGIWPCFDELDSKLIRIALPVIANFAINPLIGRYRTVQCLSGVHLHKKCAHVLHFSSRHSSVL